MEKLFDFARLFAVRNLKIARENLTIEEPPEGGKEQHEWRKLVGSIRRRVQRHASTSGTAVQQEPAKTLQQQRSEQTTSPTLQRKNSLTQAGRFDFFKRERSKDENEAKDKNERRSGTLTKQKSVEPKTDKAKIAQSPTGGKHSKKTDSEKKSGFRLSKSKGKAQKDEKNRDDFLKATMRIFLVVSPPAGKIQVLLSLLKRIRTHFSL